MSGTTTATSYRVVTAFRGYSRGTIISDPATINAILNSQYASYIVPVTSGTDSGSGGSTTVSGNLSGVPSSATAGGVLSGGTFTLSGATNGFVVLTSGGSEVGGRVAVSGASGAIPALAVPSAAGTYRLRLLGPSGQTLAESGSISVTSGSTGGTGGTGGGTTTPAGGSLGGVPSSAVAGGTLSGVTYTLTGTSSGSVVILSGGSAVALVNVSGASGTVPALTLPASAGNYTVQLRDSGGNALWQSALTLTAPSGGTGGTTTVSGSLAGVPGSATAGTSLSGITYSLTGITTATVAVMNGSTTVSSATVTGNSGTVSALALPNAAGSVSVQLRNGTTVLWQTTVTVNAASTGGGTTAPGGSLTGVPANATAGASLSGVTYSLTGTTTGSVAILSGGVVQSSVSISGASGTVPGMTFPGAAGVVVVQLRDGPGNALWQTTVTLAAAPTGGTQTPGATISGPSAAAVAGQNATFLIGFSGGLTSAFLGLLSGGVPTGTRVAASAAGLVSIPLPTAAGPYSAGVFSAATGGTKYAETPVFTVAAATTGGTGSTIPAGGYIKSIAPATDGSGKLIATLGDGTAADLTAAVQGAVVAGGVSLDAVDAVSVDFPTAVTAVVASPLSCTGSVNFRTADHHGKTLVFGAGGTLALAAPADAVPGSWCRVLNTAATAQVALGAGVVSAGGNTVAAGQSVTVVAAAGPDGVVRLYAATSLSNQAAAQTLSFSEAVGNQTGGTAFTVRLSYTNGTPTGLEWATSATGPWTVATGAAIADAGSGTGSASFQHPGLATATTAYTLRVRDRGNTGVFAVSNAFAVTAPASTGTGGTGTTTPTPTIAVTTPAAQTAGAAFTVSGTYANGTPSALDVSTNGGSTWTAVTAGIGGGTFSFSLTIAAAGTYAIRVRDRNNTGVVGTSGTFTVAAASTGTGTGTGGGTTTYTGPLDAYTSTWTGLFSASRRLRAAYTGPAIRVRRVADGVEQDIAFTSAGALDTATLSAFVGSGNGAVVRWYDQGGAGRNAIPKAGVASPVIVQGGVVQTMAGKPAIRFLGASGDTALVIEGLPAMTGASLFVMAAFQAASLGDYGRLCSFYKDDPSAGGLFMFEGYELQTRRWFGDGSGEATAKAYFIAPGANYVADAEYTGAEARIHVSPAANLNFETAAFTEGFGAGSGGAGIGSALTGNADEAFDGLIGEFAMSHAPAANERANLAAAMRSHFGVVA